MVGVVGVVAEVVTFDLCHAIGTTERQLCIRISGLLGAVEVVEVVVVVSSNGSRGGTKTRP